MSASDEPVEIVISYAHRDQELKDDLIVQLSPLRRQSFIAAWHDRDINAGDDWKREIDTHLNTAGMVLLLVSPDFIASDYCYEIEMKRALERHDAGECRVIPVFLRACDWKGSPFGRLQGLPDDAIPVVSAQWPSRDDAFLRVAQGIRRVAEKWRTEKTTAAAKVTDSPRTVTLPPPFAPSGQEIMQAIDDSGPGVMIDGKYFESDSVIEHDNSRLEVRIAPLSAEEEADLRALRPDQRAARGAVSFSHGNEGFMAQVRLARSQSTAGRRVWTVELERIDPNRHLSQDVGVNNITADEIATMRARLLLLGEQPQPREGSVESLVSGFVTSVGQDRIDSSIFPKLWIDSAGDLIKFLRFARLSAVFWLKKTNTCQGVLELCLGPVADQQLHVRFRGRRETNWPAKATTIAVEGECSLEPGISEKKSAMRR